MVTNWYGSLKLNLWVLIFYREEILDITIRQIIYRSVNGIFGKIHSTNNPTVMLSLINGYCMPVLLYGLKALQFNSSSIDSINFMYSSVFSKVFKTQDKNTIKLCKYYSEICQHRVL